MFTKKIKPNNVDITLSQFVDKYAKDYYVNVAYENDGSASVFVGTSRKDYKMPKEVEE